VPHQEALTVIATIRNGRVEALKKTLGTIKDHVNGWDVIPFNKLANLHFARLVVFDEAADHDGNRLPAQLSLMTNIDAPFEAHLHDLATLCGPGLDELFGHCEGYPDTTERTPAARQAFLHRHHSGAKAFYVNRQGRTVKQILGEEALRRAISEYLDSVDLSRQPPESVRSAIIDFVRSRPNLTWALNPAEEPHFAWRVRELLHRIAIPIGALVLAPLLLLSLPLFVALLRSHEKRDIPDTSQALAADVANLRADEDHWTQNQVIAVGLFKRGWFRWLISRVILGMTDYACRHIYNRGSLSGLNTIHFARWVPLDGGRRMFFSSNYDGSLESYMNDFIDKAAWGLNAIFTNGDGFPRTAFLFCGGITDEKAYKRFLPTRQVQSRVWYSAYPHLTTKNIANNTEIRKGLANQLSVDETKTWLTRFGVGNQLPQPGTIARFLDGVPWDKLCRLCK
jgi:hypothetical protein